MNELRNYVKRKFNLSDDDYRKLVENERHRIENPTYNYDGLTLEEAQDLKMTELDADCTKEIVKGFDYTVNGTSYHFSLSLNAQSNFKEVGDMFKEGKTTSEKWTVLNNETGEIERITLDEATFTAVRDAGRPIVRDNISKFRDDLQPKVEACTSVDEVKAIKWT